MLSLLSNYDDVFGPLRILRYISTRTLLAAGTAALIGFVIGPWLIAHLRRLKFGQHYDDDRTGDLAGRFDKKNTPTMGGLLIFACVLGSSVLWAAPNIWVGRGALRLHGPDGGGLPRRLPEGGAEEPARDLLRGEDLLADGHHGARADGAAPAPGQLGEDPGALGSLREASDHRQHADRALAVFVYFWIVGFSNAINLTDGLDGLAIGCTITVALTYGIMAYAAGNAKIADYLLISFVPGTGELAVVCGALVGAGVAFLWYNSYPAELFMGDTGSLALGGLLGIIAFMVQQPLTLVIVGGVFVWEALSVVIQVGVFKYTRRREGQGRRFFLMAPIHHHFQKLGWPETKVVLRFWILSLIFALAGLGTLKIR
jgi:phospho-N-acetylmuramoyl-pentapeptide-transferase